MGVSINGAQVTGDFPMNNAYHSIVILGTTMADAPGAQPGAVHPRNQPGDSKLASCDQLRLRRHQPSTHHQIIRNIEKKTER